MTAIFALFVRSVRDDLRSISMLLARTGIACTVFFSIITTRVFYQFIGAPGLAFFRSVVWVNFLIICIAGLSYFSSSVTEEKEEGTLGLLRMTDLSPFAILLGKSTSRLIGGLLLLIVQVPFVMLAITMGGVSLDQVLKCYALLGAFLFFACNIGLLGSVIGRSTGSAAVISAVLGVAYLFWPMAVNGIVTDVLPSIGDLTPTLANYLDKAEAIFFTPSAIGKVLNTGSGPVAIGGSILALLGGGIAAFLFARICFDRFCGEESSVERKSKGPNKKQNLVTSIRLNRPGRAWSDAVAWRDFHYLHGGRRGLFIKLVVYSGLVVWFAVSIFGKGWARGEDFFSLVFQGGLVVGTFDSLFSTSRIYRLERRDRTLSSLCLLPQDIEVLIRSKRRAVLLSLAPAFFFVVPSFLVLTYPFVWYQNSESFTAGLSGIAFTVAQVLLVHYLVALFSLKMKWGGLPLSLILWGVGSIMWTALHVMYFGSDGVILMVIPAIAVAIALRVKFLRSLVAVAAEE